MDTDVLSRNNHAFFYTDLAMFLMGDDFESIVRTLAHRSIGNMRNERDRSAEATFALEGSEVGYVQIGKASADLLARIDTPWWNRIPGNVGGSCNDRCLIVNEQGCDITLQIIAHEGPRGIVFEQAVLQRISNNTPLGFFVAVCVTPTGRPVPEEELVCLWGD